jgi:para-nitrobenzyl esterase
MRPTLLLSACAIMVCPALVSAAISDPIRIESGLISGSTNAANRVRAFKGIPYAAPPVGDLRWRPPQPPALWDGVRKAEHFGPVCMQTQGRGASGPEPSEDCLYLNVWTAAQSRSDRRPVIVWSYGGGFYLGSGSQPNYDGEALARKGAVVVTYNYRLGVLGFFSHPGLTRESAHHASGNYGLMDLVQALHWVQKNIEAFGGDPSRVTIDGESAGAILVAAATGSPEASGLFKRAISQSGGFMGISIAKMTTLRQAEEAGKKLAADLGASDLTALRALPASDLLKFSQSAKLIVDGWYIPEDLSSIFAGGKQNPVDILVGSNRDEGTFFVRPGSSTQQEYLTQTRERFGDLAEGYLKLHPAASDAEAETSRLAGVRDEMGWHMRVWARMQTKIGNHAYLYYFTRVPPTAPGQPSRGATHTAEIRYMFNNLDDHTPWTEVDRKLADMMSTYWVNFAATGDPNGKGFPAWPAYDGQHQQPMVLGDQSGVGPGIDGNVLAFFDQFYQRRQRP